MFRVNENKVRIFHMELYVKRYSMVPTESFRWAELNVIIFSS